MFGRFERSKTINQINGRQYAAELQRFSSHNSNIKCVDSTIKCIGFESFYYIINLDVVSSFIIFSGFDSMFLSMYC